MDELDRTDLLPFLVTYWDQNNDFTILAFAETVGEAAKLVTQFLTGKSILITGVALLHVAGTLVQREEKWQNTTTDELNDPLRRQ